MMNEALNAYKQADKAGAVEGADRHKLIQMLMQGALDNLSAARGHIERKEIAAKGEAISRTITLLEGLRMSLDTSQGKLAENLDSLYEYMSRQLMNANLKSDVTIVNEVAVLLGQVKDGWDQIREQAVAMPGMEPEHAL